MERTKVAFWLNAYNDQVDYVKVEGANPGIGGTEFLFWTTSYYLKKQYNELEVFLFGTGEGPFPKNIKYVMYENEQDVFEYCKRENIDYLIIRGPYIKKTIDSYIQKYHQKTIVWSHNLENYPSIKRLENNPFIIKNVCVTNEQLYWIKDTNLYEKSTYIYNGLNFTDYKNITVNKVPNRICYIGNLYPRSGIETLACAWKIIKKRVPNAQLLIIGGNNLYNFEIMKSSYSKKSFKRQHKLLNSAFYIDGKLDDNVYFTGVLRGKEKLEVMASAEVGIANITDAGDTFGLGAIEFQALGVPVVSIGKYGLLETVNHNITGLLVKNYHEIAKNVVRLLKNPTELRNMHDNSPEFVYKKFDIYDVVDEWKKLIDNSGDYAANIYTDNRNYDLKPILNCNIDLKKIKVFSWLPSISLYRYLRFGFRRVLEKLEII